MLAFTPTNSPLSFFEHEVKIPINNAIINITVLAKMKQTKMRRTANSKEKTTIQTVKKTRLVRLAATLVFMSK